MELKTGMTALVTGASSGIGEAIARALAKAGMNLVLVARSQVALQALALELSQSHGIRAVPLTVDLRQSGCGQRLRRQLQAIGMDAIDVLVNNAGFGTYGPFEGICPETEQDEIAVNVSSIVDLTHAFLPGMLSRHQGAVLNLASTASFQPGPYMAVYAASKAFVLSFSEALWAEYRERGVHVVALCPGAVDTPFIDRLGDVSIRQTSIFSSLHSADKIAQEALIALRDAAPSRIVGIKNWLMVQSSRVSQRSLTARISASLLQPPWVRKQGGAKNLLAQHERGFDR
jgi:hypothetical protein